MFVSTSRPELLAPAGTLEKLRIALRYGADAVYLGGSSLNLRAKAYGFDWDDLDGAVAMAHGLGKKVYYCLNAFARENDLGEARAALHALAGSCIDGIIVADPGIFHLARQELPGVPVHVSTQANVGNSAAAMFWRELGAKRVNLAREMSLRDIRTVTEAVPDIELEVFVHGAVCLALSGRCSLSAYLNNRVANRGQCTQPCRFQYKPVAMSLEERLRPGEILWEVCEEQGFSAFFSPRDLCLVKYLAWLWKNKITALKIEGRMRSAAYVALVCDVYRTALDDLTRGTFRPFLYLQELRGGLHRSMDAGFFLPGDPACRSRRWESDGAMPVVASILERTDSDIWRVQVLDRWEGTHPVQLMLPKLHRPEVAAGDYALEDENGTRRLTAHPGSRLTLRCNHPKMAADTFLRQVRLPAAFPDRCG